MATLCNAADRNYGQLELNKFAAPRTGRIEAQLPLDETVFSATAPAQNGMLLKVDYVAGHLTAAAPAADTDVYALNYTSEHIYDERTPGLKNFCTIPGEGMYCRVGFLEVGDKWTTNAVTYDTATWSDFAAIKTSKAAGTIYAGPGSAGYIELTGSSAPSVGPVLVVEKCTTMPDGQPALKFAVVKA